MSMLMLGVSRPSSAKAQTNPDQQVACYVIADGFEGGNLDNEGIKDTFIKVTGVTSGSPTAQVLGGLGGMSSTDSEAIAIRTLSITDPTAYTIFGWDRRANLGLFTIDRSNGSIISSGLAVGPTEANAKVEGMTFALDEDADPSNDQLWFSYTPDTTESSATQLAGFDINTGLLVGGPFTITDNQGTGFNYNSLVDIAWDAQAGVVYGVLTTRSDLTKLVSINPTTGTFTIVGDSVNDLEGLTSVPGVGLYGTTGNDNDNSLYSISTSTGAGTQVLSLDGTGTNDEEAIACIDETPLATPTPTETPEPPTPTPTQTPEPPTPTPTGTPEPPTPTPTETPEPPTPTPTETPEPGTPTPTPTGTPEPPTPTPTETPVPGTPTPTLTPEALDPTATPVPSATESPVAGTATPTPTPACTNPGDPNYPNNPCATPTPTPTPTCTNPGDPNYPNNPCPTPTPIPTPGCTRPGDPNYPNNPCPTPTSVPVIVINPTSTPMIVVKPTIPPPPPVKPPGLALTGSESGPLTRLAISVIMAGTIIALVSRFYAHKSR